MRRAYSYVRFSDRRQMAGDSLRRQLKLTEDYCERNGLFLDESLNLRDLGVPAFRGENADTGALALFLEAIKLKRVPRGSVLVVEQLDRVSRSDIDEALPLFMGILKAGVSVVTVRPEREYTAERTRGNIGVILEVVLAFVLANEESRKKSERVQDEWRERFNKLDEGKVTARAPSWLRLRPDRKKFELIPAAAAVVRKIFRMAEDGYGVKAIVRALNEEGVPTIGRSGTWHNTFVHKMLSGRAAIGEYQSFTGYGREMKPFGPPIEGYFPAVVPPEQFYRVQKALRDRKQKAGPRGRFVTNLLGGMLRDARDHGPVIIATKLNGKRSLASAKAMRGEKGAKYVSFPMRAFEDAVLELLDEVKVADVLPASGGTNDAREREALWSGRACELEHKIAQTRERIDRNPDIAVYLDVLADLERQWREARAEHDRAKQDSASGAAEAVGEMKSLVKMLRSADPDELAALRSRLRARIAEVVAEGWCLFTTATKTGSRGRPYKPRVAVVQLHFRGDPERYRSYLIATNLKTGEWWSRSLAEAGLEDVDLRRRADARAVEKELRALNLSDLEE
jgi:DNA invertase Pin-like site-specific DNA recombinase